MDLDSAAKRNPLDATQTPQENLGWETALPEEAKRRQRLRSFAIAWALFAFAVLVFLVTIVRLGGNVANRPL